MLFPIFFFRKSVMSLIFCLGFGPEPFPIPAAREPFFISKILSVTVHSFCFSTCQKIPEMKLNCAHPAMVHGCFGALLCFGIPRKSHGPKPVGSAQLLCNREDMGRSRCSCPRARANSMEPILGSHQTLLGCGILSNKNGATMAIQ